MERDLSFEALAEATGIDLGKLTSSSRGQLNRALAEIRGVTPELEDDELAIVISGKAETYRKVFAGAMITPTALSKHWPQLDAALIEQEQKAAVVANRIVHPSDCDTCGGDRMVLERYRPAFPTMWALDHRSKRHPHIGLPSPHHREYTDGYEEYLPCPSCNPVARVDAIESVRRSERLHPRRLPPGPVPSNRSSVTKGET